MAFAVALTASACSGGATVEIDVGTAALREAADLVAVDCVQALARDRNDERTK